MIGLFRKGFVFILVAFSLFFAAPVLAANITIVDNSGTIVLNIGNLTQNATIQVNVSNSEAANTLVSPNVTFFMPYGVVNVTQCGSFAEINRTTVSCFISFGNLASGVLRANLTIRTNISAFTTYGAFAFNFSARAVNLTEHFENSTLKSVTATTFFKNPRPDATPAGATSATFRFTNWNQTDADYKLTVPIMSFDQALGRPVLANNTFGEILVFDKSFFEFPTLMRLYTYNLTFRVISAEAGSSFRIRSPINNSDAAQGGNQTLIPLLMNTFEVKEFENNQSHSVTNGFPSPSGFTIFWNNTNQTQDAFFTSTGINISYNIGAPLSPFDQSIELLLVNVTSAEAVHRANNSDISVLFTLMGNTSATSSPVFVKSQFLEGFGFDKPPAFGETVNMTYVVNITNPLKNFTLNDLKISFMLPMNVTMNGTTYKQFNMTRNVKVQVWNSTAWVENASLTRTETNISFLNKMEHSPAAQNANITIYVTTFDVLVSTSNHLTMVGWNPNSDASAYVNFTAEISFPAMEEADSTPGTAGSANTYNVTAQATQRTAINLTNKLEGLTSSTCGSAGATCSLSVKVDGVALSTSNFTLGSLVLNDVDSGTHTITVSYNLPAAAAPAATTTTSSGGGGGVVGPPKDSRTFTQITPGVAAVDKITNAEIGIKQIIIEVNNPANNVQIIVTKLSGQPASITKTISGTVLQYLEINTSNLAETNIASAKIKFNVTKAWLSNNSFDVNEVSLRRFANNEWQKLTTSLISESATQVEYEAATPGFSTFAITGEQVAEAPAPTPEPAPAPQPQPEQAPPYQGPTTITLPAPAGIELLYYFGFFIVVIVGGYWYYSRRKRK